MTLNVEKMVFELLSIIETNFQYLNDTLATCKGGDVDLSRFDNKLTEIALYMSMANSRRNSFAPIARLPPELLSAIFLENLHDWQRKMFVRHPRTPPWVVVSHVCRHWRDVSLNCAELWTHISLISRKWADEFLKRSKAAPLTVRVELRYGSSIVENDTYGKNILDNLERVQDIWIDCPDNVANQLCAKLITGGAPLLQSLHMSVHPSVRFIGANEMHPGAVPRLRDVHLVGFEVDWASPVFSGLTALGLSVCSTVGWNNFLLTSSQWSSLRLLYLDSILSEQNGFDIAVANAQVKKIALPVLEELFLFGLTDSVMALFIHLDFPQSATVQLVCDCEVAAQDLSIFRPFMVDRFCSYLQSPVSPQSALLRSLHIRHEQASETSWKITCGTSNLVNADGAYTHFQGNQALDDQFPLQFEFNRMHNETHFDEIMDFFRTLPRSHLNIITLDSNDESPSNNHRLWEAFQDSPALRSIRLECSDANKFIRVLKNIAPTLMDIELKKIDFGQDEYWGVSGYFRRCGPGCLRSLCDALASRAKAGFLLRKLCFDGCPGVTEDNVRELSKVVSEVVWMQNVEYLNIYPI